MTNDIAVWVTEPGKASVPKVVRRDHLLNDLQNLVGGYIEVVYNDGGQTMLAHEEGIVKGEPVNTLATQQARHALNYPVTIVGTTVLIPTADFD